MNEMHLASCKKALEKIVEQGRGVCSKYVAKDPKIAEALSRFDRVYAEKIKDLNPKIMIYGIYNAGKSTLLNALIGEEKAAMADVPTTVAVSAYQWNEYTIYDTPGINAPKKDEEVSKEQLEKSDVIIFVMDTEGAFNLGKNYRELVEIVQAKKRLLIVLNNKSGYDMQDDSEQLEKIKSNVYTDFASMAGQGVSASELAKKFKLIVVNAQDALTARTDSSLSDDDREVLLQGSNIEALEAAIIDEYARASGFTVLAELAKLLDDGLCSAKQCLQDLEGDKLSKKGLETYDELIGQQSALYDKVVDFAKEKGQVLRDDIYRALTTSKDTDSAKTAIETAVKDWAQVINEYLIEEAGKVADRVDRNVGEYSKLVADSAAGVDIETGVVDETSANVGAEKVHGEVGAGALTATVATAAIAQPLIKKGIVAALPLVKAIPFVGPVIAPILPVIVPVFLAVAAFKALFGESGREKEEQARMEQARMQMQAQIAQQQEIARRKQECAEESARIARKIESGVLDQFRKRIGEMFAPLVKQVQDAIAATRSEATTIVDDLRVINLLHEQLQGLVSSFNA